MEKKFKAGNVVTRKGEKINMCVKQYDKEGKVICDWFDEQNHFHEEHFNEDELQFISH